MRRSVVVIICLVIGSWLLAGSFPVRAQLDSFILAAENEYLRLYINPDTSEIAVEDLINDKLWFSNPQDRSKEKGTAFERVSSQFSITRDPDGIRKENYKYSVVYNQFEIIPIDHGIRVNYQMVEEWKPEHYTPVMISKTRMEEMILANIDPADRNEVLKIYDLIMLVPREGRERDNLPGLDQEKVFGDYHLVILSDDYLQQEKALEELQGQLAEINQALQANPSRDLEKQKSTLERNISNAASRLVRTRQNIIWQLVYKIVEHRLDLETISDLTHDDVAHLVNTPTYLLKDLAAIQMKKAQNIVMESGYTPLDSADDHLMNNMDPYLPNIELYYVPIEYRLDGPYLVVRVPAGDIEYPMNVEDRVGNKYSYPLTAIGVLEYFGAANTEKEGYIFVPDGSGALIYLNNGRLFASPYNQLVFGNDNSRSITSEMQRYPEQALLPVFGMKQDDQAFVAIIEEGAALARIKADISGRVDRYNRVWAEFDVMPKAKISLGVEDTKELPIYQAEMYQGDCVIRYAFLGENQADYVGMAGCYRQYLIDRYQLERVDAGADTPADTPPDVPFFLELIGAVDKTVPIFGIARNVIYPLTTFDQAQTIVQALADRGIRNAQVKYNGWLKGGLYHVYPLKAELEKSLGSEADLHELVQLLDRLGYQLYPSVGFQNVYRDQAFDGFSPRKDAARLLNRLEARVYQYRLDIFERKRGDYVYILSPRRLSDLVDSFLKDYERYGIKQISLFDLAREVNSDFVDNVDLYIDRVRAMEITVEQLAKIKARDMKIMVDYGNGYAIPFADIIINLPTKSSEYSIINTSIPFYQIVAHGLVDYAGPPVNLSADHKAQLLKMLETGSYPYFIFCHERAYELKDTDYNHLYAIHYGDWLDLAAEMYRTVNAVLGDVQDRLIIDHCMPAENVYQTTFENGKSVIVNYGKNAVVIDGLLIEGESFAVKEATSDAH